MGSAGEGGEGRRESGGRFFVRGTAFGSNFIDIINLRDIDNVLIMALLTYQGFCIDVYNLMGI